MSNNSYNFSPTLDGIKSIEADNITTQTLSMTDLSVSGNFELGTITDVEQAIIDNTIALTGITYDSGNDRTNIDNNVTITSTKANITALVCNGLTRPKVVAGVSRFNAG